MIIHDKEYYVDKKLIKILHQLKLTPKNDDDRLIIISGKEGSGKSTLAKQIGYYWDKTLNMDRVCFSFDELKEQVHKLAKANERFKVVIGDEIHDSVSGRRVLSTKNQDFVDFIRLIRQFNLYVILCVPSYFEMDRYPASHRANFLFRTINRKGRYYFECWNEGRLQKLYKLKRFYDYSLVQNLHRAGFGGKHPLDDSEYRKKKKEKWEEYFNGKSEEKKPRFNGTPPEGFSPFSFSFMPS